MSFGDRRHSLNRVLESDDDVFLLPGVGHQDPLVDGGFDSADDPARPKYATPGSTLLNLSNTIVGAGSLALPYAFRCAGWLTGSFILVLVGAMSALSFMMLVLCSERFGINSYPKLAERAFGPKGTRIAQFFLLLYTFGSCSGYCVLIGDNFTKALKRWLSDDHLLVDRQFLIPMCGLLMIMFSLPRNLDPLKYASVVSIVCIMYVVGMCFIKMLSQMPDMGPNIQATSGSSDIFLCFPLLVVAYTCHYNALRFYHELGPATRTSVKTMSRVVTGSMGLCTLVYLLIAFGGYLMFGENTKSNILTSWPQQDDPLLLIALLAMGMVLVFSFPLVFNALRSNLADLLGLSIHDSKGGLYTPNKWHWLLTAVVPSVCVLLATQVDDIGVVLGFNGSVNGVMLVYVLPSLIYLKLMGKPIPTARAELLEQAADQDYMSLDDNRFLASYGQQPHISAAPEPRFMRAAVWFTLVAGASFGIIGVIVNINKLV